MITRNEIYSTAYDAIIAQYPSAFISAKFEPVPAGFPAVFIREISNFSTSQNMTFSGAQGVKDSTFEVQIISNKTSSPMSEAYGILDVVQVSFGSMYYRTDAVNVIDDGENGIYRLRVVFRRVLGAADTLPIASTVSVLNQGD